MAIEQGNKGRLVYLQGGLDKLAEMLIKAGVVKSDLVKWIVMGEGKSFHELEKSIYSIALNHKRTVQGVADILGVDHRTARDMLTECGHHAPKEVGKSKARAVAASGSRGASSPECPASEPNVDTCRPTEDSHE